MTRADVMLLILIAGILPFVYLHFWQDSGLASQAQITDHNHHQQVVRLDKPAVVSVQGKLGISKIEVAKNKIRFIDSPCASKFCIHSGWLRSSGAIMACLPNGILVELSGGQSQYDAINY